MSIVNNFSVHPPNKLKPCRRVGEWVGIERVAMDGAEGASGGCAWSG